MEAWKRGSMKAWEHGSTESGISYHRTPDPVGRGRGLIIYGVFWIYGALIYNACPAWPPRPTAPVCRMESSVWVYFVLFP